MRTRQTASVCGVQEYVAAFEALMLGEFAAVMLRGLEETVLLTPEKCITGPVEEVSWLVPQLISVPDSQGAFASGCTYCLSQRI